MLQPTSLRRPALLSRRSVVDVPDEASALRFLSLLQLADPQGGRARRIARALASGALVLVVPERVEPVDAPSAERASWLRELAGGKDPSAG